MDSLLVTYASSEEEEEEQQQTTGSASSSSTSKVSSLFLSLPQPKETIKTYARHTYEGHREEDGDFLKPISASESSSIFSSLPQPKQNPKSPIEEEATLKSSSSTVKSSSIFFSLPQPKSQVSQELGSISDPTPKRVVQFKFPLNPRPSSLDDEDEDDEDEKENERKKEKQMESSGQDSSVKSFLSTIPAPKNSSALGVFPSSGSGRRSIVIETEAPTSPSIKSGSDQSVANNENYQSISHNEGNHVHYEAGLDQNAENYVNYYANYGAYDQNAGASVDASGYRRYENSYGGYAGYGDQYGNNWGNGSEAFALPEVVGAMDSSVKRAKRGKNEIPAKIVEVKQDELIKNRPREDQVKSTGIAFGPSYQPASSKGKPTKLHKRKHQITSLYFDMKQKEMELAERRSRGLLTKAETQAKYGW